MIDSVGRMTDLKIDTRDRVNRRLSEGEFLYKNHLIWYDKSVVYNTFCIIR